MIQESCIGRPVPHGRQLKLTESFGCGTPVYSATQQRVPAIASTLRPLTESGSSTFVNNRLDMLYSCKEYAAMSKPSVELTEAEWSIIKAVWEIEPCTAPDVQEKLFKPTGWHYSTVRTLMDRMVGKGVLKSKKEGKLTIYRSAVTRAEAQRGELFYALKHAFNGALAPMVQCLLDAQAISAEELGELKRIIAAHEPDGDGVRSSGKKGRT